MSGMTWTGLLDIDARLEELGTSSARKVTRSALNRGMSLMASSMRQALRQADISPELRKALRPLIGKRLKVQRFSGNVTAKVGFGVGKSHGKQAPRSGKNRGGVGISGANVHWIVLGTADRYTKDGSYRGRIEALKIVVEAMSAVQSRLEPGMAAAAAVVLEREALRLATK